ncbi:AraC-type DNA-binding protein [Roseomonas rosea]|uniref:AraC-type DNA-binding protein n=1 Tax=Muricoccus roseus TaxID=198092 RepID=A0A1M6A9J3_9PROT|nr:AraC family transcriptional regulator [Roseomonas rosea]SHI33145.1 AraC-type DNA-binding protein [Roseomonas rosea]
MLDSSIPPESLALRACRLFETTDAEDARSRISRVMQPHALRFHGRGGATRLHMDFLRLGGVGLGTIALGAASIEVPPLDEYHLVLLCLSGHAVLRRGGEEFGVGRNSGAICLSGQPFSARFSADCEQLIVRIDRARLAAFEGDAAIRLARRLDLGSARLAPFLTLLRGLATEAATVRMVRQDRGVAADYEQLLLRLLLAGAEAEAPARNAGHARPASLRRAKAFMEAQAGGVITLAGIAEAAGVPERTLHDAFRRFEGTTPMRWLRNLRLDQARARLRAGAGEGGVTAVALGVGFTHLSRFAQDYAERFGERPSETMRRR